MPPRIRFRSPGVKPGQKIGPLGPFRGRLGLQWVVAPILVGVALIVVGWLFLRGVRPGEPWQPAGTVAGLEGPRQVSSGVWVARHEDGSPYAVAEEPGCPLRADGGGYRDCDGEAFEADGTAEDGGEALDLVPLQVFRGELFIDPTRRIDR